MIPIIKVYYRSLRAWWLTGRINRALAIVKAAGYTAVKLEQIGNDAYLVHPDGTRYKLRKYS